MTVVIAQNLSKKYGQHMVVDNVSFSVSRGACCGILGPNGAGKTTTLRMLVGNISPSHGNLEVLGYHVPSQAHTMRTRIGVVPQKDNLDPNFSVIENLYVYGQYFGLSHLILKQRISELLKFISLEKKAHIAVPLLSGGMQRRLSLARALLNEPDLLILDEPTTGLDPQARQLMWQRLRRLKNDGLTLILTTHYMEEAERLCDHLIIMDNGHILEEGAPYELIRKHIEPQVIEIHTHETHNWDTNYGESFNLRSEQVGDSWFYYGKSVEPLLQYLQAQTELHYLYRPANLEDVFLKLTGRDLRDG